ncbi:Translation initiation factor 2, alpha subunit, middle domain [Pseudocohnilembus persalinus]|uniref:Translation initiation factor 2, alpha subunit, middle domain n=1 Tax=Pseudocohnilembus persalinus TaxID=266149 RepID=A0A0V0QUV3_PSEPJ|nr:Translation initiation factor 2, alpha subunit, middle domain [Pseudocohnilembus persalinus]|eukprot:KRX05736.1 Translation initiation factor 2, alpha subunit, middle domain [Pseudocohnilembus persalinus]
MEEGQTSVNTHRFYLQEYPKEEDLVVVQVTNIEENASYVSLLEYNRIEGMITPNELTKTMKQSVHKALKLGKQEVVRVLRVDKQKGYIDLSKREVSKEEELKCLDRFSKSKQCNTIVVSINEKNKTSLDELYNTIIYPLYEKHPDQHPLEIFTLSLNEPSLLDELKLDPKVREILDYEIARRLKPQSIRVKTDFELSCYGYEGVNAIVNSLKVGEQCSTDKFKIKFYIVGSPVYSGSIQTSDRASGIKILNQALEKIEQEIKKYEGGAFKLKVAPKVYGNEKPTDEFLSQQKQQFEEDSDASDESEISL